MAQDDNAIRQAIVDELARAWRNVAETLLERPPGDTRMEFVYVSEFTEADWARGECRGERAAVFRFDERGLALLPAPVEFDPREARRGQYFRVGRAHFHVAPDCQRGVLRCQLGPRTGLGVVYELKAGDVSRSVKLVS